jgi:hypothetical protein
MRHSTIATAAMLLGLALPTQAKESPRKPPLDRAALARCVALEDEVGRQRKAYNVQVREGNELVKQQAQIRGELDQLKMAIEAGDSYKIDAYNGQIEEHNAIGERHAEYKLRMAEISEKQRIATEEFNGACAGRQFMNADLLDIKKPRKK